MEGRIVNKRKWNEEFLYPLSSSLSWSASNILQQILFFSSIFFLSSPPHFFSRMNAKNKNAKWGKRDGRFLKWKKSDLKDRRDKKVRGKGGDGKGSSKKCLKKSFLFGLSPPPPFRCKVQSCKKLSLKKKKVGMNGGEKKEGIKK